MILERVNPDTPDVAVQRAIAPWWSRLAPARPVLVGVAEHGHGPGVGVAPWTRTGLVHAATAHGLSLRGVDLSRPGAAPSLHTPLGPITEDLSGHAINLDIPGARRPRRIPSSWFGAHLCLVMPCVFEQHDLLPQQPWMGPVAWAFGALDDHGSTSHLPVPSMPRSPMRGPSIPHRSVIGARLSAQVFASITVVIDAAWWAPVKRGENSAPELVPLGHCVTTGASFPDERWSLACVQEADAWLARRLQLCRGTPEVEIEVAGTARGEAWPRATLPRARGLASQTLHALWSRRPGVDRGPQDRRLPPAVPGPLAKCWQAYSRASAQRSLA